MANTNAEKFIINLQARYTGREEITRLQNELDKLGQVENLQKWRKSFAENITAMRKAGEEAARLKTALESSYDEKVLARLQKAEARLAGLQSGYARQSEALDRCKREMDAARAAQEAYAASLSATPTDKEAARLAELAAALVKAENAWKAQQSTLAETGRAIDRNRKKVDELREALRNSVDPELKRQYEAQIRLQERHAKQAAELRQRIEQTATALRAQGVNTRNLAAEQQQLNAATEASGRHLAAMRTLGVQSFSAIEERVRQLRQAWNDLDTSNMSMRERFAHWTRYRQSISEAREQTNGWTTSVRNLQAGWAGVLGVLGGLSIMGKAAREFAGFETGMLKVQALTGATGKDFDKLNAKAKELGASTRYSAREAADGMYQLAAAGMDVDQIMNTIPSALHMAAAAEMDVGEAADKVTNIMSQFGMTGEEAARKVADVMTAGFTGAATSMRELSDAMVYCGPVANALGYSLEETTAILQALANAGYKGEKAGTALRGGFTRLIKPMRQGREVLEQYNIQITDASGVMRPFADILEDIGKAGMSTAEMIKVFGQEAGPGMIALLGQGADAIRDYEKALENVDGKAAALAEHVESGLEGAWRRLQAGIAAIAISFGETFGPALTTAVDLLAAFASWIAGMPEPIKLYIGALSGAAAAYAMWKMGLGTMSLALRQFALDLAAGGKWIYNHTYLSNAASLATRGFQAVLGQTALAGRLHAAGLAAANIATKTFTLATRAAGFAMRALPLVGMAMLVWDLVRAFWGWINQFTPVQKFLAYFAYGLNAAWIGVKRLWAAMTGGDVEKFDKQLEEAQSALNRRLDEIDAESEKRRKEKEERETAEREEPEEKRERRPDREKLDALEKRGDEREEDADLDEDAELDEDEAEDDPFAEPERKKRKKRRGLAGYGEAEEEEREEKPLWQRMYDEVHAREQAERERRGGAVDGLAEALAAAEDHARRRHAETADAAEAKLAAALPEAPAESGAGRRKDGDEAPAKPDKVVELKLGNARLRGGERDVEDFVTQLERGMATA